MSVISSWTQEANGDTDPAAPTLAGAIRWYFKNGNLFGWLTGAGSPVQLSGGQPSYCGTNNNVAATSSTTANNVVDTRAVPAAALASNNVLLVTVRAFLTGTANTKSIAVVIDADPSNALTATFAAGQTGIVEFVAYLLVKSASPHMWVSRADYNMMYAEAGHKRGTCTVNLATTAINVQTQAWVANAGDSITFDSIDVRQSGNGL